MAASAEAAQLRVMTPTGRMVAGEPFTLAVSLTASGPFPQPGQRLRVELPHYHAYDAPATPSATNTRLLSAPAGSFLRFLEPRLAPIVSVSTAAGFEIVLPRQLSAGESVEAEYGPVPAQELAVSADAPGCKPFVLRLMEADGRPGTELTRVMPDVLPGAAERLRVMAPAVVRPGASYDVKLVAIDRFGNVASGFSGETSLGAVAGGFGSARLTAPSAPAILRLEAKGAISGRSNPVMVRATGDFTYFGDLHVHCGDSSDDAYGSFEDAYRYARDVQALDFVAKTDHDGELTPGRWERTRELVRRYDAPGRFVPLLGFEWTPSRTWGHRTVLFPGFDGAVVPCGRPPGDTPEGLWKAIAPFGGIGIPHHPSAEPVEHHRFDWTHHDDRFEPLVEIHSQWNASKERFMAQESETNPRGVQAALAMGHRLGILAGTDSHVAMGGRRGGLAGVRAPELTRESLWRALLARQCFATTGARMLIELRGGPALTAEVHATAPISRLEIVRGWPGAPVPFPVVATRPGQGSEDILWEWSDPSPLRAAIYYLRVELTDGEKGWSSPLWVERANAKPTPPERPADAWQPVAFAPAWLAGALETPPAGTPRLSATPAGILVETPAAAVAGEARARHSYFHVRCGPLPLTAGRRYRLTCRLASRRPAMAILQTLDGSARNPGFFAAVPLPGNDSPVDVRREFAARDAGPADLYVFLPAQENGYHLQSLALARE